MFDLSGIKKVFGFRTVKVFSARVHFSGTPPFRFYVSASSEKEALRKFAESKYPKEHLSDLKIEE
tara:strand:- start:4274 stop:4468 length:195 start_codon:yes stop_codon:yes gene_type:complete